jgi:hypothetical protein
MKTIRPVLPAALIPALFCIIVYTPAEVIGCRNRGLLAVAVILIGLLSALALAMRGLIRRRHGQKTDADEIVALLLLLLPAIYLALTEL